MSVDSKRKPYVREVKADWWKSWSFYRLYVAREVTSIPTVWFCLVLLYGVISLSRGELAYTGFIHFLQNPIVVILNIITLGMLCLHTVTWFNLVPKAVNLVHKGEQVPTTFMKTIVWSITAVVTIVALILALL